MALRNRLSALLFAGSVSGIPDTATHRRALHPHDHCQPRQPAFADICSGIEYAPRSARARPPPRPLKLTALDQVPLQHARRGPSELRGPRRRRPPAPVHLRAAAR